MAKNLKVFKIDDYSWVIAESKKQAIEWYNKEYGYLLEEDEVYEVNYSSTGEDGGYWDEVNMSEFDVPQTGVFKNWNGMFCRLIWFHEAIKSWGEEVPALIATTEV